jgi:hypothetical protein
MEKGMTKTVSFQRAACSRSPPARQGGWGASEYLSVLVGLMVVWWGAQEVLTLTREHHDEFTWALMMPF